MRKDLKFIRMIKGVLILVSGVLLILAIYDHSSAFMKGWNSFDELQTAEPRFKEAVFQNVIYKTGDVLHITGKAGYVFNLQQQRLVEGTVYNLKQDNMMISIYAGLIALLGLIVLIISFKVFSKLYYFLDDSSKGEIFTLKNIDRIKQIGFYAIALSVLLWTADVILFLKKQELFSFTPYQVSYQFDFNYVLFAAGMTAMAIMYVFKKGYELQKEQELTI
ncbi:DUF2975 domain-containing protein [Pedobacter gandavensis]|uniref:DUF2975 domain-containing protein n=1 Tax=Pedobacter gandavensis TaxID=2679963 RepID=UPI00292E1B5F|nr:DUF2975 domain-containing protein [Pedobacter gandavensis]